jgi:hypothetical protein
MQRDAAYLILFHIKKFHKKMRENRNKMELKKQQAALNKNQKNIKIVMIALRVVEVKTLRKDLKKN